MHTENKNLSPFYDFFSTLHLETIRKVVETIGEP